MTLAFAVGNVDDGGFFGDLVTAGDHAAEEQIFSAAKRRTTRGC